MKIEYNGFPDGFDTSYIHEYIEGMFHRKIYGIICYYDEFEYITVLADNSDGSRTWNIAKDRLLNPTLDGYKSYCRNKKIELLCL